MLNSDQPDMIALSRQPLNLFAIIQFHITCIKDYVTGISYGKFRLILHQK